MTVIISVFHFMANAEFCTCEIQVSQITCPNPSCYWENNKCSSV